MSLRQPPVPTLLSSGSGAQSHADMKKRHSHYTDGTRQVLGQADLSSIGTGTRKLLFLKQGTAVAWCSRQRAPKAPPSEGGGGKPGAPGWQCLGPGSADPV